MTTPPKKAPARRKRPAAKPERKNAPSPDAQEAPTPIQPRWVFTMAMGPNGQIQGRTSVPGHDTKGVTQFEIGAALHKAAVNLHEKPNDIIPPDAHSAKVRLQQAVMRDYPAKIICPSLGGALICPVCAAAFEDIVEKNGAGEPDYIPLGDTGGVPIPCSMHLDPSKLPAGVDDAYRDGVKAAVAKLLGA